MSEEQLYTIGVITGPHGRWGKLKVHPITDYPQRFRHLKKVYLVQGERREQHTVVGVDFHGQQILLILDGIKNRTAAGAYQHFYLKVPEEDLVQLPPGHYFFHEIIGLLVYTQSGTLLGTVKDILRTGSNDVYVVQGEKEILLPATREVIRAIHLQEGFIQVQLLEGLNG